MLLEIEIQGLAVLFDLLYVVEPGANCRVPGGADLLLPALPPVNPGPGKAVSVALRLDFDLGMDSDVTGNWLYQKLKGRVDSLRIDGAPTIVDRETLVRCLESRRKG